MEGLEFFAYHGFHKEEKKMGNRYGVDIMVDTNFETAAARDKLTETIDYTKLYEVIRAEMQQPSKLLEHIAQRISTKVLDAFPQANAVEITVSKYNPPIGGICKRAYVSFSISRHP